MLAERDISMDHRITKLNLKILGSDAILAQIRLKNYLKLFTLPFD